MIKKVVCVLILVLLCSLSITFAVFAEDSKKPTVAVMLVNNGKTTYDAELGKKINDNITAKLGSNYSLVSGNPFVEKLNKNGITDITTAERSDIVQAFTGENVDFVVYVELQPVLVKSWVSFFNVGNACTVTLPLKIIDIPNNKYLYNGKFVEQADNSAVIGNVGTKAGTLAALDKAFLKMNEVLAVRIPLVVEAPVKAENATDKSAAPQAPSVTPTN